MDLASWVDPLLPSIHYCSHKAHCSQVKSPAASSTTDSRCLLSGRLFLALFSSLLSRFSFTPQLAKAKREGFAEYGALASSYVTDFDHKWLRRGVNDEQLLGTVDIQSLADLGNSFTAVREMRTVPFVRDDVVRLLVITIVPSVPLLLTIMPLDELVPQAIKIVF